MTEKALTTVKKPDAPAEWGSRGEIGAMADRLKAMLPGADKLESGDFMAIAQYCRLMDLNPFRGDAYFYRDKGRLVMVDGYKVLRRWAERQCPFLERYDTLAPGEMNGEPEGTVGIRCWILREDRKATIGEFTEMGFPPMEAFKMAAVSAVGVVRPAEYVYKNPPTGWTVEQVARKRAMKNALNLSHGAPSPRESAALSWEVNGAQTIEADWDEVPAEYAETGEAAEHAAMTAVARQIKDAFGAMSPEQQQAKLAENNALLRGDHDPADPYGMDATQPPIWDDDLVTQNQADEFEPPPDCLIAIIPNGKYEGKTVGKALAFDLEYVRDTLAKRQDATGEAARAALKWKVEQEQEAPCYIEG